LVSEEINSLEDIKEAQRLFKEARQKAHRANEPTLVEKIKGVEETISRSIRRVSMPGNILNDMLDRVDDIPPEVLMRLMSSFPDGPPKDLSKLSKQDIKDFEKLMELMGGLPDEFF
jgi:hypothetical protein